MNNAEKFEQNLLKSSVSNNLDAAKREWSLYRIDWVDRAGVCICGKTHISKLVIIMNSVNGKFLEIGADCAYEHLGIEVREEQYRQLKEAKNPKGFKRLTAKVKKHLEVVLINGLKHKTINSWEFIFSIDMLRASSMSRKQRELLLKIVNRCPNVVDSYPPITMIVEYLNKIGVYLKGQESRAFDTCKKWNNTVSRIGVPNKCVIHIYDPMLLRKALTLRDMVHETGLESYVKSGSAIIRDIPKILRFGYE